MKQFFYPVKYIRPAKLKDGTIIQLRPIHPSDASFASRFKSSLSDESIKSRFLGYIPKISKRLINQLTDVDFTKEVAIIAEIITKKKKKKIIGIARIAKDTEPENSVDFALIISDKWQGKNLGDVLTDFMIEIAKDMGFTSIHALTYNENKGMLEILKNKNFQISVVDDTTMKAQLEW